MLRFALVGLALLARADGFGYYPALPKCYTADWRTGTHGGQAIFTCEFGGGDYDGGYGGVQVAEHNAPYYCGANSETSLDSFTELAACVAAACDNYQIPDGMNDGDDPQWSDWGVLDHATECYS